MTLIFSDFHEKFSLVLLQMIYYIFTPWKMQKRMQYSLNYSGFFVFVHWKLKLLNFLLDSVLNYRYAYVEIHSHPWFILIKKEKNFHIKTKENLPQNTEFPRTCSLHCSWRFVCCVQGVVFVRSLWSERCLSNKPPASLRRLKNLLTTNFVSFH